MAQTVPPFLPVLILFLVAAVTAVAILGWFWPNSPEAPR